MTVVDEAFLQSTAAIFPRLWRAEYTLFFACGPGARFWRHVFSEAFSSSMIGAAEASFISVSLASVDGEQQQPATGTRQGQNA